LCEIERERPEAAIVATEKAIALRPGFALAHHNLGVALRLLKRLDEAEQAFRKALSIENLAMSQHSLGLVFDE
jgi:Flp pilus assembly protein TadD